MKLKPLVAAVGVALALPGSAMAGSLFNFSAGAGPFIDIGQYDWGPTSILGQGSSAAIAAWIATAGACPANSCDFYVDTMAALSVTKDQAGIANTPAGLGQGNGTFEVTMAARFLDRVTSVVGSTVNFATVAGANPGTFVEIYLDYSPDANQVTGAGFNDGILVGRGSTITSAPANFSLFGSPNVALDQFGANNYVGQNTSTGFGGSGSVDVGGWVLDPVHLTPDPNLPGFALNINYNNIGENTPFQQVDPAMCFQQAQGAAAVGAVQALATAQCGTSTQINGLISPGVQGLDGNGGYVPNIGNPNGVLGGGPDFLAQTDFNSSASSSRVPEPATLALLGIGLGFAGMFSRRRRSAGSQV